MAIHLHKSPKLTVLLKEHMIKHDDRTVKMTPRNVSQKRNANSHSNQCCIGAILMFTFYDHTGLGNRVLIFLRRIKVTVLRKVVII